MAGDKDVHQQHVVDIPLVRLSTFTGVEGVEMLSLLRTCFCKLGWNISCPSQSKRSYWETEEPLLGTLQ